MKDNSLDAESLLMQWKVLSTTFARINFSLLLHIHTLKSFIILLHTLHLIPSCNNHIPKPRLWWSHKDKRNNRISWMSDHDKNFWDIQAIFIFGSNSSSTQLLRLIPRHSSSTLTYSTFICLSSLSCPLAALFPPILWPSQQNYKHETTEAWFLSSGQITGSIL